MAWQRRHVPRLLLTHPHLPHSSASLSNFPLRNVMSYLGLSYGLNFILPKFIWWSPNPQYLRMSSYLEMGLLQTQLVELGWGRTRGRWAPNPAWVVTWTLMRWTENITWRLELCDHKPRNTKCLTCVFSHVSILVTPMDCSPPGSSVHGILQARIQEWVAISYSKGSSWPRDQTQILCISCMGRRILTPVPPEKPKNTQDSGKSTIERGV